jgi:hypothetical protein
VFRALELLGGLVAAGGLDAGFNDAGFNDAGFNDAGFNDAGFLLLVHLDYIWVKKIQFLYGWLVQFTF